MSIPAFTVYQDTWQGNQLQYATDRTNELVQSNDFTDVAWTATTGVTATAADNTGPDGTTSAGTLVYAGVVGSAGGDRISQALDTPAEETPVVASVWLRSAGPSPSPLTLQINAGFGYETITVNGTWNRYQIASIADGSNPVELAIASGIDENVAFTLNYAFAQVEEDAYAATSYIPTTTLAVTVADYSFNVGGTQIVFAVAPIVGASITGKYINGGVIFDIGTGDGTTTDFDVPTSEVIELPVPQNFYSDGVPANAFSITPSDTVPLTQCTLKIYVGGSGALTVIMNRDDISNPVTFQVVAHNFYDLAVNQVMETGTSATGIIGLN